MAAISIRNLVKRYGNLTVIPDLSLEIADHEFVVFVGPSGCGKSTLLRIIAGLEPITSGDLHIGDKRVNGVPAAHATSRWCSRTMRFIRTCGSTTTWRSRSNCAAWPEPRST